MKKRKIFIIVQHLIKCNSAKKVIRRFGEEYEWAGDPNDPTKFHYEIIVTQSILRPVLVIPSVTRVNKKSTQSLPPKQVLKLQHDILKPNLTDRFYFIDREFFDRSGWEEVIVNDNVLDIESTEMLVNYVEDNQTGFNRLNNVNVNKNSIYNRPNKRNFGSELENNEEEDECSILDDDEEESGEDNVIIDEVDNDY